MEGDTTEPLPNTEGEETKKEILSNTDVTNEDANNEQKQTEDDLKSSKVQITDQAEKGEQEEENVQKPLEVIGEEQQEDAGHESKEETGDKIEEKPGEEQEEVTGPEDEKRDDQDQDEGKVPEQEEGSGQDQGAGQEAKEDKQEEADEDEEMGYVEPPPPDPAAPLNLTDSQERLKPRFELRPEQLAEIEQLWDLYQDYTPAYTDIKGYITEIELVYLLKCLLLMTYTPEQLQELIAFCVRPPHPEGHITFDQFVKMATIRQRDYPVEDELRAALQVLDTGNEGMINREYMMEVLMKQGHKMNPKLLKNLIKEVDIRNDGTIGIDDVVGTMCVDLTSDDMFKSKDEEENPENPEATQE